MPALFSIQSPEAIVGGCVFTAMLVYACISDVRERRIPNRLVGFLALTGIVYSTAMGAAPLRALLTSLAGLAIGFALWIPFYAIRWLGAGDVKFFAAVGAWLGPLRTLEGALIAALVGGVLAVVWMLRVYGVQGTAVTASLAMAAPRSITNHPVDRSHRRALPYGIALSVGAAIVAWVPRVLESLYAH